MPRLRRCRVSLANQPSTALAQEHEVGVKWKVTRGWRASQPRTFWVLVGSIVVQDHMDRLVGRHFTLDGIEKADEFLVPVALHAATDDLAFQDIQGGEQGGGTVALVVVGHRGAASFLHRQTGLGAIERPEKTLIWTLPSGVID